MHGAVEEVWGNEEITLVPGVMAGEAGLLGEF